MASPQWSSLHRDILSNITRILNSDVDILRLRAVCKSWRSSIRPRLRPSPFPLKIPTFDPAVFTGDHYLLNYTTLYRISPPEHGPHAADPSDGWLLRVRELNPSRFLILAPLCPDEPHFPPRTIPNCLNLLDYRITEICKCYGLILSLPSGSESSSIDMRCIVTKIFILSALGCDFVVLLLYANGILGYWKFGDESWTRIHTKGYYITDMALCEGRCYAITSQGALLSFDSELNMSVLCPPPVPVNCLKSEHYLVEYNSDLYLVSKILKCQLKVFKKGKNSWKHIRHLGDVMFFSSNDVSVGLSAEDFRGKSNCVHVAHVDYFYVALLNFNLHADFAVYRLHGDTTSVTKLSHDQILYWPPPAWLVKIAKDIGTSGSLG